MPTVTKTITLVPSGYTGLTSMTTSSSQPITNGYTDASSGTYAQLTLSTSTTGYVYYTFDTSDIPAGATITSVTAQGKARVSNTSRVTNTVMQLYSGTTAMGSNRTFATTTASTQTITAGTWTRAQLNDLRIRIGGTGSSSTSSKYIRFYGADVTVTYTIAAYTVSASGDGTLDPSGSTTVESGESYVLHISGVNSPTVTDNNVDVTSQLTQTTEITETAIPSDNTNSGWYSVTDISNAYNDADNDTYASLQIAGGSTTATIYLTLSGISIPSGATIKSVSCRATLQFNANSSSSGFTSSCQMYAGSTAKGSAYQWVSSGSNVAKNTYNLTVGSWTASEIANARFYLTATNNASSTRRYVYIYGVSFAVTYESDGITYVYTISSVTGDHTIVVIAGSSASDVIYFKDNGAWVAATKVYKKINGSWVEQSDLTSVFNSGTNYVRG